MDVIAHRGASADAPEHTLEAYELALVQGAGTLELDVRATADGELVVVHDRTLWRTALDPRRVARMTCADLARLDARVRPLTFAAVLAGFAGRARLLVELKDPDPAWETAVTDALRRHDAVDRAVLQSFDASALHRLKRATPELAVAPLVRHAPVSARRLRTLATWAEGLGVWHGALDAAGVARLHAAGLAVRAWTVNTPAGLQRVARAGVDGVITDVPAVACAAVATARPAAAAA